MIDSDMNDSILDAIGNTPLVAIRHLNPNPNVKILAKLEYFNPGGSIKDRIALAMIEAGERCGDLTGEKTVIEATSGNTGIGLALVCSVKGYRLLLAMSEAVSVERRKILKARGAEILLTPGHMGTDGAIEEVYRLARENPDRYFMADQYNNEANWMAHYHGTAEEIWRQTDGSLSAIVATMGTAGTLMGLSRRLKERNKAIRIVGVEPYLGHKIQGLKNMKEAYQPEIYEKSRLDCKINIDDEEAFEMTRRLALEEGLFVGMSSGAAMAIAVREALTMDRGTIVVIFPDSGERYLSTSLFDVKEKVELRLFNTLSRQKEIFHPGIPGKAAMYSCGPTAHAPMQLSECRRLLVSDLISRYLSFRGFDVNHVMNITDLDDKTIAGSEKEGVDLSAFTEKHIREFENDLETLGINPADVYPKTSEHVSDMVSLAEQLVDKGFAYEKLRSLYFDISKYGGYGKLSGIDINKIRVGATVDLEEYEKSNPRDFTLMKRSRLSELKRGIYTKTRWGNVRPSWHIQCAAMSMKYLGESFDIHASSRELIFPHHENEIAIAGALTGKPLARYWIHCERVYYGNGKDNRMEECQTLHDLLGKGFSGRELRFWLLSAHYRKPITYSNARIENAKLSLKRLDQCISSLYQVDENGQAYPDRSQLLYDLKNGFISAMDDDLNISAALAAIFTIIKQVNSLMGENRINSADASAIIDAFRKINIVLNVFNFNDDMKDPRIVQLIRERETARQNREWDRADKIRDVLAGKGINLRDKGFAG